MSIHESVFLIAKDKCDEFCKLARLKPKRFMTVKEQMEREKEMEGEGHPRPAVTLRIVTQEEMQTPEYRKTQSHYKKVWDFVHKNGKQPFKFNWSGAILGDVLGYLLEEKKICLMENQLAEEDGTFSWYILDKKLKDKYLKKLNPANFTETDLKTTFEQSLKQRQRDAMVEFEKKMTPEMIREAEKILGRKRVKEMLSGPLPIEEFPERGEAMLDGIKYMHQYLERVDDDAVLLINIG